MKGKTLEEKPIKGPQKKENMIRGGGDYKEKISKGENNIKLKYKGKLK